MEYMKIGSDTKERLKRIIRDTLVVDPMISLRGLQAVLLAKNIKMGNLNSLAKVRKEITAEAVEEADRTKILERFVQMDERARLMREQLFRIIFPSDTELVRPTASEQISAMNMVIKNDLQILRAALDMGVYRKDMPSGKKFTKEEEAALRNKPIPEEYRKNIMRAFKNWGIIDDEGNFVLKEEK
jgi:uncharacterized protein YnzC (UPF0291/DUF896 family)